jgi:mannose-1-phosphate guanylyltransferase
MAGGSGERFWPLSTKERPKQLLRLIDEEKSLIRMTVDRVLPMVSANSIFIGTNAVQAKTVLEELPMLPAGNVIIEPSFKDTAAAIGFGCIEIGRKFPDSTLIVLASDHLIKDEADFRLHLKKAVEVAEKEEAIVTLGIKPDRPETGYGYLETGADADLVAEGGSGADGSLEVEEGFVGCTVGVPTRVLRFCEKPALEVAMEYLKSGRFLWNSGMFIFRVSTIMKAFAELLPAHWAVFKEIEELENATGRGENTAKERDEKLKSLFEKFVKISIDFGIMEKFKNTYVIPVDFGWSDIGSYPALADVFPANENGTTVKGASIKEFNSGGNIVIGTTGKTIALLGVHDMVVVETADAILVCTQAEAQNIKKIL